MIEKSDSIRLALATFAILGQPPSAGETIPQGPALGQSSTAEQIDAWDISVFPNGTGLPPGRGSVTAGEAVYNQHCAACHGPQGLGGAAEELAGGHHGLAHEEPDKTIGTYWPYATTLFDFIRRSMPLSAPRSLTDDQVYAVTAYLLHVNGIIEKEDEMNARALPKVIMPNRDGFILYYPDGPTAE